MNDITDESRRKFLKVVALGGVAVAATPLLMNAKILGLGSASVSPALGTGTAYAPVSTKTGGAGGDDSTLVVVVKNGQVTGYRGAQKVAMNDLALGSQLHTSFESYLE